MDDDADADEEADMGFNDFVDDDVPGLGDMDDEQ
jgi:hypothetical protein